MPPKKVPESVIKGIKNKEALVTWMLNNIDHSLILQCLQPSAVVSEAGPSRPAPLSKKEEKQAATQAVAEELGLDVIFNDTSFGPKATLKGQKYYGLISQSCPMIKHLIIDEKTGAIAGKVPGLKGPKAPYHRLYITKEKLEKVCKKEADAMLTEISRNQGFGAIRFNTKFLTGGKKAGGFISKAAKKAVKLAKKPLKPSGFVNPQQAAGLASFKAIKSGKSIIGSGLAGKIAYQKARGYNRKLAGKVAKSSLAKMKRLTGRPSLRNLPRSWMAFGSAEKEEFKARRALKRRARGAVGGLKRGIKGAKRRDRNAVKKGRKVGGIKGKLVGGMGRTINVGMAVPMVGSSVTRGFIRPSRRSRFGKVKRTSHHPLREKAKKLGIRITRTVGGKRVYKTDVMLKNQIKTKMSKSNRPIKR